MKLLEISQKMTKEQTNRNKDVMIWNLINGFLLSSPIVDFQCAMYHYNLNPSSGILVCICKIARNKSCYNGEATKANLFGTFSYIFITSKYKMLI